jgi:hypothetical protein
MDKNPSPQGKAIKIGTKWTRPFWEALTALRMENKTNQNVAEVTG